MSCERLAGGFCTGGFKDESIGFGKRFVVAGEPEAWSSAGFVSRLVRVGEDELLPDDVLDFQDATRQFRDLFQEELLNFITSVWLRLDGSTFPATQWFRERKGMQSRLFALFLRKYAFWPRDYILDKPKRLRWNDRMKTEPGQENEELTLKKIAKEYADEDKARALLESMLWPDGPVCPHCKNHKEKPIYKLQPSPKSKSPARKGVYKCGACRQQFTVTVNTVFEGSHIPISTWLMAIFIICASKKSVSSKQLERMLGVTYKTAWFMAHRIRFAMMPNHWAEPKLKGTVEVDETFVGGKTTTQFSKSNKTPVVALVERGGIARVKVVASVTQHNLGKVLYECVDKSAVVNTDEHTGYRQPLKQWKAHHRVVHSKYEYHRKNPDGSIATTNSAESFFSLLKRGIYGAWHHVSREHLPKYANEFAFRWSHRHCTDGKRMERLMPMAFNKRLMYRQP